MVQSGSKRFDFFRKCINFSPAGGCGSGLHGSEFPHHIHVRVQYLHLLHVLPAYLVLYPVLEAEHQRADSPARVTHTWIGFGFWILDSGFGFGLDWITDAFAIHLLSFAIICCHLPSGGGNLLFCPGFSGAHPTLRSRNTARPHLAEPDHVQACHGSRRSFITKMVLTNKWYMER